MVHIGGFNVQDHSNLPCKASMVGHLNFSPLTPPATLPVNMQMSNEKYYCFWKRKLPKPDTCKSRNHRIPWPHPVFFAKAAHKLDCPIIAHLRIILVVVVLTKLSFIHCVQLYKCMVFKIHFTLSHWTPSWKNTIALESNLDSGDSRDDVSVANKWLSWTTRASCQVIIKKAISKAITQKQNLDQSN